MQYDDDSFGNLFIRMKCSDLLLEITRDRGQWSLNVAYINVGRCSRDELNTCVYSVNDGSGVRFDIDEQCAMVEGCVSRLIGVDGGGDSLE
jgi:hypothetical protein